MMQNYQISKGCKSKPFQHGSFAPCVNLRPASSSGIISRKNSRSLVVVQASKSQGGIGGILKKIQGSLPIIGLVSRLTTPEGGFDGDMSYPEYCRSLFERSPREMSIAMQELESKHGRMAASRWVFIVMWMVETGLVWVPAKDIVAAAKRLRITQDVEVEVDRFLQAREASRKKYDMIAPPSAKPADVAAVTVDALSALCLGLKPEQPVPADDAARLTEIVVGTLKDVPRDIVTASIQQKSSRAAA